jgi:hypothetical protein
MHVLGRGEYQRGDNSNRASRYLDEMLKSPGDKNHQTRVNQTKKWLVGQPAAPIGSYRAVIRPETTGHRNRTGRERR